jgi:monofunctional glycosyltransferase
MAIQAVSDARRRAKGRAGRRRRHPWLRRAALVLLFLFAALLASIVVFRFVNPPITMVMLVEKLKGVALKHHWVPLDDISPNLPLAVISSEDGRFCEHWGVDWGAVRDAIDEAHSWKGVRGASTIPMQTAKNLYLWKERSYLRKALEVPLAYIMTAIWPKKRMIEVYLNIVQWGPGIYGASAASHYYFGKPASALSEREAVLLAAALPNPRVRNPAKPNRRMRVIADTVERRMPIITERAGCILE